MGFNNIGYLEKDKQALDSAKLQGKTLGTNPGDVMVVGSFGIGTNVAVVVSSGSVNDLKVAGNYRVSSSEVSDLPESGTFIVEVIPSTEINTKQRATLLNTSVVREYTRRLVSAGWSAWVITADVSSAQTFAQKKISFQNANDASPTVLDWYEEGTFTPTVQGNVTLGTGTYSTQQGRYTRIGNKVFFDITVKISAHNGTGQIVIAGLPFVSNATQESSVSISYISMLSFNYIPLAHVYPNSATVRLLRTVANSTPVYLVFSDITGYPFELRISGHYTAA